METDLCFQPTAETKPLPGKENLTWKILDSNEEDKQKCVRADLKEPWLLSVHLSKQNPTGGEQAKGRGGDGGWALVDIFM